MRVLTPGGRLTLEADKARGELPCPETCVYCYTTIRDPAPDEDDDSDIPDPKPVVVLNIVEDGQRRQIDPRASEIQRLTLENSELRGTISCMQAHRLLSKGG